MTEIVRVKKLSPSISFLSTATGLSSPRYPPVDEPWISYSPAMKRLSSLIKSVFTKIETHEIPGYPLIHRAYYYGDLYLFDYEKEY